MDAWIELYRHIFEIIDASKTDILFFRGHNDTSWKLSPTLARLNVGKSVDFLEGVTYFDFQTRAGSLLPESNSS